MGWRDCASAGPWLSPEMIEELWRRHEYAVIAAAGPSMKLAEIALQPAKRKMLLDRQKKLSREGHAVLENWVQRAGRQVLP